MQHARCTICATRVVLTSVTTVASLTGPVVYAFSLGLVGAVNPCGFPLLPAYLMLSAAEAGSKPLVVRLVRGLWTGAVMTVGFMVVFGALGLAIKAGVGVAIGWVPWVMIPIGAACVAAGVLTVLGRPLPLPQFHRRLWSGGNRTVAFLGFGVAYAVASLSCSLPIFLAGVVGSFTRRGVGIGLSGGLAYALGMGLVVAAVSLAAAGARPLRARSLRAAQPIIQRLAGAVLVLVGAYLLLYWITALATPLSEPGPVRAVEGLQRTVSGWLAGSPRLAGMVIGAVVLATLIGACVVSIRAEAHDDPQTSGTPSTDSPQRHEISL